MKINLINIMAFIIYHIIFVSFAYIDNYNTIILTLEILMLFLICLNIKLITNKRFNKINFLVLVFFLVIIISSIISGPNFQRGIIYGLKVLEIFLFWECVCKTNKKNTILKMFFYLTLIYTIITDILIFFVPNLFIKYNNYFIGNKFYVSYFHILLFILYICIPKNKKMYAIFLYIFSMIMSIVVNCNTALIGCILIGIFYLLKDKLNLINPIAIILVLLVSSSVLFVFRGILNFRPIQYFIVEVLNEDLTLTGRLEIYDNDIQIILKKPFLGYGYGNSHDVMYNAIKAPNTQNGILECVLNFGVIGTSLLLLIIYNIFKNYNKQQNLMPIIVYIYVFAILGMVEITINITYIALIAMLNNGNLEKKGENCGKLEN